jgi:hypothetical protein
MATGDETITLTSSVDKRVEYPIDHPVWERLITASYDADDAGAVTHSEVINGILLKIIFTIPTTTTTGTTSQLLIKDNNDDTIFDSGELAEGSTYTFDVFEPLSGTIDITYEPSAAAGSAETPTVTLRGI